MGDPCKQDRWPAPRPHRAHDAIDADLHPEEQGDIHVVAEEVAVHKELGGRGEGLEGGRNQSRTGAEAFLPNPIRQPDRPGAEHRGGQSQR